ncbi:MAG: DUF192 domain-containing protein [Armatimonadota bacterium]|nr:DUF192 domain-containing protein [Armatimonadota bacterium]
MMRRHFQLLSPLVVVGFLLGACLPMTVPPSPLPFCRDLPRLELRRAQVQFLQGDRRVTVQVEVADTPEARELGLMCRTSLPKDAGMLFLFEESRPWAFWMKNTLIPLSIAFVEESGRVVDIQDMDVEADPTNPVRTYAPPVPVRYAVEVNRSFFRRSGITVGARMKILW